MYNIIDNSKFEYFKLYKASFLPNDLLLLFAGETGNWIVFSAPTRDERGDTHALACYQGSFEDVLNAAKKLPKFLDCGMCGKIVPLKIQKL